MKKQAFSYSPYLHSINILLSALMIALAGFFSYLLLKAELFPSNSFQAQESFVAFSIPLLIQLLNVVIFLNWEPDFVLQDEGIVVKVYHFWERTIPWKDVVEVKRCWIPITGKRTYVVVVSRLTPLHVVIGMMYGLTLKPAFVITNALNDREEAAKLITSQIGKESMQ